MCGRFRTGNLHEIDEHFRLPEPFPGGVHLNISPTDTVAIIPNEEPRHWMLARWGLIPPGARDPKEVRHTFNARIESLGTRGLWRGPFLRRRCLVPADGFYDWTPIPGSRKKQAHLVGLKDRRPFAFAGLWDQWKDSLTGEVIRSFTIITCPPNDFMRLLHDRMPLILPSSHWSEWLDPRERSPEELARALVPLDDTQMREELCGDPRQLEEAAQRGSLSLS